MDYKTVIVLDIDDKRRNEIYRTLAHWQTAIPVTAVRDLGPCWPESAWFLVHDNAAALAELQREFARRRCFHPIVVYSGELVPSRVVAAIYEGAMNYIVWPSPAEVVRDAIASVAAVAKTRCEHAAARLAAQDKLSTLSPREVDVLACMSTGMTSKEIGRQLGISHRTVEIHRANAIAKIGARNTADATRTVVEAGEDSVSSGIAA